MNGRQLLQVASLAAMAIIVGLYAARQLQSPASRVAATMDMLPLPGGSYQLGTATPTPGIDVSPPRTYEVRPLRLARLDVTFDQYDSFARATGRALPDDASFGRGDHPVINVTGEDIEAFIAWLNSATGRRFRLPTEVEWEYAARAGTSGPYFWGDAPLGDHANTAVNGGRDHWIGTSPVGSFPPNGFGLRDMLGNVWQRVEDCWHSRYESEPTATKPFVTATRCHSRIVRGGSWFSPPHDATVTARTVGTDHSGSTAIGFRLAEDR